MESKKIKDILNEDDICFICDFLEANIDLCDNKKYCEKLIKKLEKLL